MSRPLLLESRRTHLGTFLLHCYGYEQCESKIEPGMKVAVRRGVQDKIGVVVRLEDDYVVVHWTHAEQPEELEFRAHRDDVKPLDGWV